MIFDKRIAKKAQCEIDEKRQCIMLIARLVEISEQARRDGLMAVEDILDSMTHPLLIKGLELVIDGYDPETVKDILTTYIYFGRAEGKILLEQCIICEGIIAIQAGENPKVIRERLVAYLGGLDIPGSDSWNFLIEVESKFKEDEQRKLNQYLESMKNRDAYSQNTRILDDLIPQLNRDAIQAILKEIDSHVLAIALAGASGKVILKIFECVSDAYKPFLKDDLQHCQDCKPKDMIECQSKIFTIYSKLKETGII